MSEKIFNTYEEMINSIGEQSGEYVFEIKQKEIEQLEQNLDKAIKALEFYASKAAYDQVEDSRYSDTRFALIEEDEYQVKNKDGFEVCKAGKFANETLKEIRGENG